MAIRRTSTTTKDILGSWMQDRRPICILPLRIRLLELWLDDTRFSFRVDLLLARLLRLLGASRTRYVILVTVTVVATRVLAADMGLLLDWRGGFTSVGSLPLHVS